MTTGISAADRAATILTAIDPATQPARPAAPRPRVPAARAQRRRAQARRPDRGLGRPRPLAGLDPPAGVICEIMNDDGTMARVPTCAKFAEQHGLLMITVADLIRYRLQHERLVAPHRLAAPARRASATSASTPTAAT